MSAEIDKAYIQCARSLASALRTYAKERREEDKKKIHSLESELCQIHRHEQTESKPA